MLYLTETQEIKAAIENLALAKALWIDTEIAEWWTPHPKLSLIQVLSKPDDLLGNDTYILDVLNKPNLSAEFSKKIIANPTIEKIFHNAQFDLKFLDKAKAQNITCTLNLAKKISLEVLGTADRKLKTLAEELCGFSNIDKQEQASDWGRRPLMAKQLDYAKMDTVYLAQVHRRLLEILNPSQSITAGNLSMPQSKKTKLNSFSVTKVRVAFECPRLFYLGHHFGGMMMFLPPGSPAKIGTTFHNLADRCAFLAKQDPQFQALFEPEVSQLKVEDIAAQMQRLFYELAFFPYLQTVVKASPGKAPALYQLWQALQGLIHRWAELLVTNRRYCSAKDIIGYTLIDLEPSIQHNFQLPNGSTQLVRGRFDSVIYDFENHRLCVLEYKTYLSPDKSAQLAQVALYSYMLREKLGVPIDSAVYSVLPDWQELTFTWDQLKDTVHQLIPYRLQQMQEWIAWESPQPNPPPPTTQPELLCHICPQRSKCQTFFEATETQAVPVSKARSETSTSIPSVPAAKASSETSPLAAPLVSAKPVEQYSPDAEAIGEQLVTLLRSFKIEVEYLGAIVGPAFIRVKLKPNLGVKVASLLKLSDDLKVQLGITTAPLIAPQAGYVSIDLPRSDRQVAALVEYIQPVENAPTAPVRIAIGVDLDGKLVEADLSDPNTCHFLVGGTTGSGKSEFLRSLLLSLLYRHSPQQLKIALVDPKRVTFPEFEQMPWLYAPVVKDGEGAIALMTDLVTEMERRYRYFESAKCNDLSTYNSRVRQPLERIVCIFDEYADFMTEKDTRIELEQQIKRLGAMARAAGIHLIVATQRPEANVVTPIIRSNLPGRVALRTASEADSAIILGGKQTLAAYLLGKGDLLYQVGAQLHRLQSLFAQTIQLP